MCVNTVAENYTVKLMDFSLNNMLNRNGEILSRDQLGKANVADKGRSHEHGV